ncbi:MAG: alpha/beta hydrolase [Cyclobacteriaceae bacterium]
MKTKNHLKLVKHVLLYVTFFAIHSAVAQSPIHIQESIHIGGIKQFISIHGNDDSLPLLVFLHGGPGGSVMSYADKFSTKLQKHFVVIQWDQRETGRTLQQNASPVPLTLDLFKNDTRELIRNLLKRFQQQKMYLVGHSWGTVLGFHIAREYPELLYAFIAVGPMVNQLESERILLRMMKEKGVQTRNEKELKELNTVNIPFENGMQLYYQRKWLFEFNGSSRKISRDIILNWSETWLAIYNEAAKDNLFESLPSIHCPVYFFAGRKDWQTNSTLTETYYRMLTAPKKNLFWFERSAHAIPTREPDLFQTIIIENILPETYPAIPKSKVIEN